MSGLRFICSLRAFSPCWDSASAPPSRATFQWGDRPCPAVLGASPVIQGLVGALGSALPSLSDGVGGPGGEVRKDLEVGVRFWAWGSPCRPGLEVGGCGAGGDLKFGLARWCWANRKRVLVNQAKQWCGLHPGVWTHDLFPLGRTPGDVWCCLPPKPCTTPVPKVGPPGRVP